MSKNKNKFKKSKKRHQTQPITSKPMAPISTDTKDSEEEILEVEAETTAETPSEYDTDQYDYVKHDIKKILIIMVSIIILLFGFYYLGLKTTALDTLGNWIYKILNIQTL